MTPDKMQHGYFQHLLNEAHSHMFVVIGAAAGLLAFIMLVIYFTYRRWRLANERLSSSGVRAPLLRRLQGLAGGKPAFGAGTSRETIFVVPDISGYTKFLAANRSSADAAQNVVFELLNAIVGAAGRQLQLAKIEGDAVFFFDDARKNSPRAMGDLLFDMFARFYEERQRLASQDSPLYASCRTIAELDLKIFVHSGSAAHFRFRDTPDVFGADVIVLHRLMKNSLTTKRYLLVTDAVKDKVLLPETLAANRMIHSVEGFGDIAASVYELDPVAVIAMARQQKKNWFSASTKKALPFGFARQGIVTKTCSDKVARPCGTTPMPLAIQDQGK